MQSGTHDFLITMWNQFIPAAAPMYKMFILCLLSI